ncbi:MAG TPA: carboxypeptidase regulatory-like domain-containing protein [Terriglobales bacterium]|nr:carboxypeptidase regulatory-like domain-containing protein [Terriglobales bacterium]
MPPKERHSLALFASTLLYLLFVLAIPTMTFAQANVSTGSIQGTITDSSGAVVANASITITNQGTGLKLQLKSNASGFFSSGPLLPANYQVDVSAAGFRRTQFDIAVQVGVSANANAVLQVGQPNEVVKVQASEVTVNSEQSTVQNVLTDQQIENLPINGRDFLSLAQLEPGVQIQDGSNFDPTKTGFSSISFGGRFGRTARIEVDGVDISDETVGTTTQNVPLSAIQEFQISQSSLDLSTELTSSGAVNVVTRSGGNDYHGEAFYLFRSDSTAARLSSIREIPFQRNQFGGRFGGPIIKNKVFFFLDAERNKQDLFAPVILSDPFSGHSGGYNSPLRETQTFGRLDWQISPTNYHLFYRFSYDGARNTAAFVPNTFSPYKNQNLTPTHVVGFDFTSRAFTHSVRFAYMKMRNGIVDAVSGTPIYNPAPQVAITIGSVPLCASSGGDPFCAGPSFLQPQATLQDNKEIKYDGSHAQGTHILRYGVAVNRIVGNLFTKQLGFSPVVNSVFTNDTVAFANGGPFSGGSSNPLNYPAQLVIMSNGIGFTTERHSLGQAGGGLFSTRLLFYGGDTWKLRPNLTLNYGLRYVRDTGRTNNDLAPIPVLDQLSPGLGDRVRQPNSNFGPVAGMVWDPLKNGKTVIRAGAGLYYENAVFGNSTIDRPGRIQEGSLFGIGVACVGGTPIPLSNGVSPAFCNEPVGEAAGQIPSFLSQFQTLAQAAGPGPNGNFIGNAFSASTNSTGVNLFAPNYQTPRSVQINVGVQQQVAHQTVLSVDYVRNVGTHFLMGIDANHVGDASTLNTANAQAAIAATNGAFGCGTSFSSSAINCAIAQGATIADFAGNGLDSGNTLCGSGPCPSAAFPGRNPRFGSVIMMFPNGRSVYNGLLVSLRQNMSNPTPGIHNLNLQVSYALSRFTSTARDQDITNEVPATDFNTPLRYIGPNGLDRTHQFSFGVVADVPASFRVNLLGHFYTALPATLTIPSTGGPGDIFQTDLTGDGTVGDVLPETNIGAFGRSVKVDQLNGVLSRFNSSVAGNLTPAGQALVNAQLFTEAQLTALGASIQKVPLAPAGEVGLGSLRTFDLKVSRPIKWERLEIEPSAGVYNLFNFANFDSPGQPLQGVLSGQPLSVNGTTSANRTNRVGLGSGVFALGAPRMFEWGLAVRF